MGQHSTAVDVAARSIDLHFLSSSNPLTALFVLEHYFSRPHPQALSMSGLRLTTVSLVSTDIAQSEQRANEMQLGDLSNDLHAIFHWHSFHCKLHHAALRPTPHLASCFLTTRKLLYFWHAAFFGIAREFPGPQSADKDLFSLKLWMGRRPRLTAAQVDHTKRALTSLAPGMSFRPLSSCKIARFDIHGKLSGIAISEPHIAKLKELATTDRDGYI